MNCDADKYGPVSVNELMAAHYKEVEGTIYTKDNYDNADGHANIPSHEIKR